LIEGSALFLVVFAVCICLVLFWLKTARSLKPWLRQKQIQRQLLVVDVIIVTYPDDTTGTVI
jgi:hypothetical protein